MQLGPRKQRRKSDMAPLGQARLGPSGPNVGPTLAQRARAACSPVNPTVRPSARYPAAFGELGRFPRNCLHRMLPVWIQCFSNKLALSFLSFLRSCVSLLLDRWISKSKRRGSLISCVSLLYPQSAQGIVVYGDRPVTFVCDTPHSSRVSFPLVGV